MEEKNNSSKTELKDLFETLNNSVRTVFYVSLILGIVYLVIAITTYVRKMPVINLEYLISVSVLIIFSGFLLSLPVFYTMFIHIWWADYHAEKIADKILINIMRAIFLLSLPVIIFMTYWAVIRPTLWWQFLFLFVAVIMYTYINWRTLGVYKFRDKLLFNVLFYYFPIFGLAFFNGNAKIIDKLIKIPLSAGKIGAYHDETLLLEENYAKKLGVSQNFTPYEIKWSLGDEYIVVKSSTSEETITIRKEKILSSSFNK